MKLDSDFLEKFKKRTVDCQTFNHEAHVFVAYSLASGMTYDSGLQEMCDGLREVTKRFGVPEKYNETITVFYFSMVASRLRKYAARDFADFCSKNADILRSSPPLFLDYYSSELINSNEAKQRFIPPNLKALPSMETSKSA